MPEIKFLWSDKETKHEPARMVIAKDVSTVYWFNFLLPVNERMASSILYCFRYFIALIMSKSKIKIKYILKENSRNWANSKYPQRKLRKFSCVKRFPKTKVLQKLQASVYNSDYLIHFKARRKILSRHSSSIQITFLFIEECTGAVYKLTKFHRKHSLANCPLPQCTLQQVSCLCRSLYNVSDFKSYLWISSYSKYLTPDILKPNFTELAPLLLSKTSRV